jgi:hypothetical protein
VDAFDAHRYDTTDYWKVQTDTDGYFTVRCDYDETVDIKLQLIDDEHESLYTSYPDDEPPNSISLPLAEGAYFIKVSRSGSGEYGAYRIETSVDFPGLANDQEPNNSSEEAVPMLFNDSETGHLGYQDHGDADIYDWWQFSLETPHDLNITVEVAEDTLETTLDIYDADAEWLKGQNSEEGIVYVEYEDAPAGTYFVRVRRKSYTKGFGSYWLSLNHTPPVYAPPQNVAVELDNNILTVTWEISPDDAEITGYRIMRSRNETFNTPVSQDSFGSMEALHEAEISYSILVGTVPSGETAFTDTIPLFEGGTYYYWLQAMGDYGVSEPSPTGNPVTEVATIKPMEFRLYNPYPNPFNPVTTIRYELPESSPVRLIVYDCIGRMVSVLVHGIKEPGVHEVLWNGIDSNGGFVGSGVYFFCLTAGEHTATASSVLMR